MSDRLVVTVDDWTAMSGYAPTPDASGCFWDLEKIEGWFGGLAVRAERPDRSRSDGAHAGRPFFAARRVTLSGALSAPDPGALQYATDRLTGVLTGGDRTGLLVVDELSRGATRQSVCQLDVQGEVVRLGELAAAWTITLFCPDPLRYGELLSSLSTGLSTSGGGLTYPLTYPLTYGAAGNPGRITISNPGTAPAPFRFEVTGPLPGGFEISAAGQRITFPFEVPAGQTLFGDTAAGTLLAEGTADRRAYLTNADWMQVPAGGSLTLQFTSLGGYDPAARLSVPEPRGAFW